jgi:hypothetical protein
MEGSDWHAYDMIDDPNHGDNAHFERVCLGLRRLRELEEDLVVLCNSPDKSEMAANTERLRGLQAESSV